VLDVSELGVDLDDRVINVNVRREHPILRTGILLGHELKFTPDQCGIRRNAGTIDVRVREPK
jgi:hypothetical protein